MLKPTPFAWVCYAVAFPLLPVYAWLVGSGGEWPPRAGLLLPIAALAGPTLQLANGIVDVEQDARAGLRGPAVRLGRRRAIVVLALLETAVYGAAWISLLVDPAPLGSLLTVGLATILAGLGVWMSADDRPPVRERGWQAQAIALVVLGIGWLLAVSA